MTATTTYHVKVRTKSGQIKTGYLPAANHADLLAKLQHHDWQLIEIIPKESVPIAHDDGIDIGQWKGWLISGAAVVLLVVLFAIAGNAPPRSPDPQIAAQASERAKLDAYQAVTTRVAQWRADGVQVSSNHATVAEVDAEAFRLRDYERANAQRLSSYPSVAENGDRRGIDNDNDGRAEPVHVNGYYRSNGTYVPEQYRALPTSSGTTNRSASSSSNSGSSGGRVQVKGYTRSDGTYVAPHSRSAPRR